MVDARLLFPSEFISAADLRGKDVTLTIARLHIGEALRCEGGKTEKRHVVSFRELEAKARATGGPNKRWVLNKTNCKTVIKLHGKETDNWIGKRVTLYPTQCLAFGETVDCIRVREEVPPPARSQQTQPAPDPEPVEEETLV